MIKQKDVPLKIELFSDGEDSRFRVHSEKEIQLILRNIAQKGARSALYFGSGNDFILTTVLALDKQGIWLDIGPNDVDNQRILHSNKIVFVSSQHQVKVQFVAYRIARTPFQNREAFYLPLPDSLLRIQRREYFRLLAPAVEPLKCVIADMQPATPNPEQSKQKAEVTIMDISVGGVALVCAEYEAELQPGKIYTNCQITLPDVGILTATIRVKNTFEVTLREGIVKRRAGCEFIQMDGKMAILLQRYITHLQSSS